MIKSRGSDSGTAMQPEIRRMLGELHQWLTSAPSKDNNSSDASVFDKGVAIVFENVHLIIPQRDDDVERNYLVDTLLNWSNSPELFRKSHCLILMAESLEDVSDDLRARGGKIEQIQIPRPDDPRARFKFLLAALTKKADMRETRAAMPDHGLTLDGYTGPRVERIRQLSHDTSGLTMMGIEDLLQHASASDDHLLSRDTVMDLKRDRLRVESDGLLEVIDPRFDLDSFAGYNEVKERIREVIDFWRRAASDDSIRRTIPMGILFAGPPGTGKSIMAEAIAGESKISLAKLGDFRGSFVGQSERNLSRIFSLIEALNPVIVFLDEMDQSLGRRGQNSGDGGVDNRVFGKMLEFISNEDHRGRILWIGATNYAREIDAAMKRPGRFDLVLPFLLPDEESRAEILELQIKSEFREAKGITCNIDADGFVTLARLTPEFSGAELRAIVAETLRLAIRDREEGGDVTVTIDHFRHVLEDYAPPRGQQENYAKMTVQALDEISWRNMVPAQYHSHFRSDRQDENSE